MRHPHKRFTKILATVGPSTSSEEKLNELIEAGVDAFRLNFSHGSHEEHQARYELIKKLEKKHNKSFAVVADMQGPKLRVGSFKNGSIMLKEGQTFMVDLDDEPGNETRVKLPHPEIFKSLKKGTNILLNDGQLRLEITKVNPTSAETIVKVGGKLSDKKGFNIPDAVLDIPVLTEKDLKDLEFALSIGISLIAVSFVQTPEDIKKARKIIGDRAKIISKIEKPAAIENMEEMVELSDIIMVARGDLGVETSPEIVPVLQKRLINECHKQGRPVIVATQMLESMIKAPVPTRAEASDVANAIYEGADAVMLSAETAAGDYPKEAVCMMDRIITAVESDKAYTKIRKTLMEKTKFDTEPKSKVASKEEAIIIGTNEIAEKIDAKAVIAFTYSGNTARNIAKYRPSIPIIAVTTSEKTARQLALCYGVNPFLIDEKKLTIESKINGTKINFDTIEETASFIVKKIDVAKKRNLIVITAGKPYEKKRKDQSIIYPGSTNILNIIDVM